jgi:hypothetical protein
VDPSQEERFLQLARERPDILCAEAPAEILEAAASDAEPTKFLEEFFATGYTGWLAKKYGRRLHPPQDRIDRAILVLWLRACLLNTDRLLGHRNSELDRPFFSDEGLY